MNINAIEVYKSPNPKIRLGSEEDGGYVICDGYDYDCIISAGVGGDISFEEAFLDKYKNIPCFAFDGTDSANFPNTTKNIIFINKNIGIHNTEKETNLIELISKYNNVFLKMDIEGHEFSWISAMPTFILKKIKQIAIEFHYPARILENWNQLNKLNYSHFLVHFHPNPGCNYNQYTTGDRKIYIPNVVECTYIRRDFLEFSDEIIPGPLDRLNQKNGKDYEIILKDYPYNVLQ